MSDNVRKACEEAAKEFLEYPFADGADEWLIEKRKSLTDIIERAMRKLLPTKPNPYAIAMEKHLCEHDMADWLACSGHGENFCDVCQGVEVHAHKTEAERQRMTDDQIKYMVNRFLGWRLPENFNPDAGISFKKTFNENTPWPMKHEPTGTNLFDATQAEEMVRYLVDGMPREAKR